MEWSFDDFFEKIKEKDLFENAIVNKGKYINDYISLEYTESKEIPDSLFYLPWSYRFFQLKNSFGKSIFIDEKYLRKLFEDFKNKKEYLAKKNKSYEYIGYEFMLNLNLSRDTQSGRSNYMSLLEEMLILIDKKGGVVIEGKTTITSKQELESYLKKTFTNFNSLEAEMCQ